MCPEEPVVRHYCRHVRKLVKLLVFIVIPALLINAWVVSRQEKPAAAFGGGHVLNISGPDVNVREYGSGSAQSGSNRGAIVLLHGYASSIEWWGDVAPELANRTGRKVIAIDLVGHGGSESPRDAKAYGALGQALAVTRALAALKADDVVLVGHSMGGHVATYVAEREPNLVQKVAVIDTFGAPGLRDLGPLQSVTCAPIIGPAMDRLRAVDAVTTSSLQRGFATTFAIPDFAYRSLKRMSYRAVCDSTSGDELNAQRPEAKRLAQLGKPVKVIWGSEDDLTPTAANVAAYRNAGLTPVIVRGSGHSVQVEKPDDVVKILVGFVK
jgi:pimeloyl-ACP methyl ester carboxylesterase